MAAVAVAFGTVLAPAASASCASLITRPPATTLMWPDLHAAARAGKFADGPQAEDSTGSASIVGLWRVAFVSGGQTVDEGFDTWHSDGTELLNDTPAPSTGNVCMGVWAQTARSTFKLYHPSWTFDANGNLNGTAIIRELVTVAANGKSYRGTFTIDVYDLAGNRIFHAAGTLAAQRITVDG